MLSNVASALPAAIVAPSIAAAGHPPDDPIFAAIEAHKKFWATFEEIARELSAVEKLGSGDPAYRSADERWCAAAAAVERAAWLLVEKPANSIAGVAALMRYASEFVQAGNTWPDVNGDWRTAAHEAAASALEGLA